MAVRSDAPLKNVLVTLDGSILAESAVKPGISMAHFMGGDVVLMSVEEAFHLTKEEVVSVQYLQKIEPRLGDEMLEHLQSQRKQYLQRVGEGVLENAGISLTPNISTVTRTGDPASTILQYAENNGVDLIVITTHGRTGIQKWRYGSVAQKILRHAACAVMVIPASFAS
jgi:nucleotide-binding universal stress UspA family protein